MVGLTEICPGMQVQTSLSRLEYKMSLSLHDVKRFLGWVLALHQALSEHIHHNKEDKKLFGAVGFTELHIFMVVLLMN